MKKFRYVLFLMFFIQVSIILESLKSSMLVGETCFDDYLNLFCGIGIPINIALFIANIFFLFFTTYINNIKLKTPITIFALLYNILLTLWLLFNFKVVYI